MAHLIDLSNHRANMAYVGETPWHGLGQRLSQNATIDQWRIEAGMAYDLQDSVAQFEYEIADGSKILLPMKDRKIIFRSDNKKPLACVSSKYKIVQPAEVLEFFRDLVGATGEYELETAGVLNEGARYWALAKYKDQLDFGHDKVLPYLLLATACDGTMATTAQHTSVRVVCNNTLQMSLRSGQDQGVKITHRSTFDANQIKEQLNVSKTVATFKTDIDSLINQVFTEKQTVELLYNQIGKTDKEGGLTNEKTAKRVIGEIMDALRKSPGSQLETAKDTKWGVMNAVTNHVDFKARAHNNNNRFSSAQFGQGAKMKKDIFNALIAA